MENLVRVTHGIHECIALVSEQLPLGLRTLELSVGEQVFGLLLDGLQPNLVVEESGLLTDGPKSTTSVVRPC